jgi:ABC-type branched-subunit amino acid transport system permease subunit
MNNNNALSDLIQFLFIGLQRGSIYAMVAMGYNIIYNSTGVINLAQGEFVVLGGLMMVTLTTTINLSIPLGFLLTVLFVTLTGILIERFTIKPREECVSIASYHHNRCSVHSAQRHGNVFLGQGDAFHAAFFIRDAV